MAIGANGKMRILRKGNNGFTCMPDNLTTPGPDPMCMDKAALEWAEAWMGHKPSTVDKIGFMYMLAGRTDQETHREQPLDQNWSSCHDRWCRTPLL